MSAFKFPRHPGRRENPFQDAGGRNPFGDEEALAESASGSAGDADARSGPYAASLQDPRVQPYRPDDYETFLPHRSGWVLWLGLLGAGLQLLAVLIAAVAILIVDDFLEGAAYGLPCQLLGLGLSVPAWILGQSDLLAMEAGAMDATGLNRTRFGLRLAIAGTLLGVGQLLTFVGLALFRQLYV